MKRLLLPGSALVLVLAACGAGHHASAPRLTRVASQSRPSVKQIVAQRKAAAAREAERLLQEFTPPPGARPATEPQGWGGVIRSSGPTPLAKLVDRTRFWQTSAKLADVVRFEQAHGPQGFRLESSGVSPRKPFSQELGFFWPRGGFSARLLNVGVVVLPTRTIIRVDAKATWSYPRSPQEKLPANVRKIAVTAPKVSIVATDSADVEQIVRWFDALPVTPPGVAALCPVIGGPTLTLRFLSAAGHVLAEALVPEHGASVCDAIELTIGGHRQTPLIDPPGHRAFADRVAGLLGIKIGGR